MWHRTVKILKNETKEVGFFSTGIRKPKMGLSRENMQAGIYGKPVIKQRFHIFLYALFLKLIFSLTVIKLER